MANSKTISLFKKNRLSLQSLIRIIYIGLIFLFCLLPLIFLFTNISGEDIRFVFSDSIFYSALGNSLLYAFISSLVSTFLSLVCAYFLSRCTFNKKALVLLLSIPMLIPTLSVGLGLRVLFGTNGFLDILFGVKAEVIGYFGLILGSIIVSFPPTFIIIYDALRYEDKTPYDAADALGISRLSAFWRITLPYLFKPLITAFFACFILIFADYGMPMELAGKVKTLPMYLYENVSTLYEYGRAAIVGLFLLIPAVISFIVDIFLREDFNNTSESRVNRGRKFNIITLILTIIVIILLITPEISFISLSFIKGYPNNISFSIDNFKDIFVNTHGVGLGKYIGNSLLLALLTSIFGVLFSYTLAYFSSRERTKLGKIINLFSMSSIAIPGIVLGVGYIFIFKNTAGWFYETIAILVAVNVIHFLGSPYIMAKNCFSKMNKEFETIGLTLGANKFKIFKDVLLPNSLVTILEIFLYYFLNSMITISAVAFLCTYSNQPLAILITTFEKTSNYEMQAVVSFIILVINLFFKGVLSFAIHFTKKKVIGKEKHMSTKLSRYQFDLLVYLEKRGKNHYTQRLLCDDLGLSLGTVNKVVNSCIDFGYIAKDDDGNMYLTTNGLQALEPYRVRRAIIIAAGFGSRLAPVTLDTPKPMVKVNGVRIIDTLIDALVNKGIENITIVRGYKKEKFDELLEKYPFIQFVDNHEFNVTNNISSIMSVIDKIDRCYICEADLFITNDDIIKKYQFTSNFMGAKVNETDDWCFNKVGGYIKDFRIGGNDCYQAFGISYWNEQDSITLRNDIAKVYNSRGGKECYWDSVPLKICAKNYNIEVNRCHKSDIIEIDNFSELVLLDSSYSKYPGYNNF